MRWWLLRLSAKILALLRLLVNFFQLRLTKKLKINFFCFKELNVNEPVFFVALKQNKGLKIISGWNAILLKNFNIWQIILFIKYSTSSIILGKEMPIVNLKRERQTQDRGRDIHL